jgi:hypothetical protein
MLSEIPTLRYLFKNRTLAKAAKAHFPYRADLLDRVSLLSVSVQSQHSQDIEGMITIINALRITDSELQVKMISRDLKWIASSTQRIGRY